jgi:hypothetical protein
MCDILDGVVDDVVGHMGACRLPGDAHDLITVGRHWRSLSGGIFEVGSVCMQCKQDQGRKVDYRRSRIRPSHGIAKPKHPP